MNEHHTGVPQITSITIAGIVDMLTSDPFNLSQKYDIAPSLGVHESTLSHWITKNSPYNTLREESYKKLFEKLEQWCENAGVDYCNELCFYFPELQSYFSTLPSSFNKEAMKTMVDLLIKSSLEHHYTLNKQRNHRKKELAENIHNFPEDPPATTNTNTSADSAPVYELGGTLISRGASKGAFWVREPARNREYPVTPQNTLPPNMSALPTYILGSRAETITAIQESLKAGELVFLNGMPGIGKTQTAIRTAMEMQSAKGTYLVNYTVPKNGFEAIEETVLGMRFSGYRYAPSKENMTMEELRREDFENRLNILKEQYKDAVIIVDNFDRPGEPLEKALGERSFTELKGCGVHLIFTTRYNCDDWKQEWKIKALPEQEQMKLMRQFCGEELYSDEELWPVIRAVHGHTLMIVLMGKAIANSRRKVTPEKLLERFTSRNMSEMNFPRVGNEWHGNDDDRGDYKKEQLYAHMCALFDLSQFGTAEKKLLCNAVLLPETGMNCELFESCLDEGDEEVLSYLLECGWLSLQRDTNLLQIHPAVREVCIEELKPKEDDCKDFLDKLWGNFDPEVFDSEKYLVKYRQMAECFFYASLTISDQQGTTASRAGMLYGLIYEQKKLYEKTISAIKGEVSEGHGNFLLHYQSLERRYENIGSIYGLMKDAEKTLEKKVWALSLKWDELAKNSMRLALTYEDLSAAFSQVNKRKQLYYLLLSLEIYQESLSVNHPKLALIYNELGRVYEALGDVDNCISNLTRALDAFKKNSVPGNPVLKSVYVRLSVMNGNRGDTIKQKEYLALSQQ